MELERAAPTQSETMRSTVTGTYMSGIGYVRKKSKLGMVRDDHILGDSINGMAIHECCPDTMSEITKVKSATMINQVEYGMTINDDEVVRKKVDNANVQRSEIRFRGIHKTFLEENDKLKKANLEE